MTGNERGVSTHCFRRFGPDLLRLPADKGLTLIELSCAQFPDLVDDVRFAKLRRMLADHPIRINSIHVPFTGTCDWGFLDVSFLDPAVRARTIEAALICARRLAELGGRFLVIHPSTDPVEDADGARRIQLAHEALREMEARLPAGADIKIAVECLPRTNLCHDSAEAVEFIQPLGERFGICLDVNHTNFREDPVQAVRAYAPHTITTHIADNDGVHEKHWMPGDGVIPWKPRYAALIAAGYTVPILYETGQAEGESTEHVVVDW